MPFSFHAVARVSAIIEAPQTRRMDAGARKMRGCKTDTTNTTISSSRLCHSGRSLQLISRFSRNLAPFYPPEPLFILQPFLPIPSTRASQDPRSCLEPPAYDTIRFKFQRPSTVTPPLQQVRLVAAHPPSPLNNPPEPLPQAPGAHRQRLIRGCVAPLGIQSESGCRAQCACLVRFDPSTPFPRCLWLPQVSGNRGGSRPTCPQDKETTIAANGQQTRSL